MRGHYAEDLSGKRFGSLTVIKRDDTKSVPYWVCKCDCGRVKSVKGTHLRSGAIISCGCVGKKHLRESKIKHNQRNTRLYGVWCNMKNRCYNKKVRSFKDYGANGINVCDEWRNNFEAFSKWAYANGYDPNAAYGKCTIDRIDVYDDYKPNNCRWVDAKVQANNRRNSVKKEGNQDGNDRGEDHAAKGG